MKKLLLTALLVLVSALCVLAQNEAIVAEAEAGTLGADYTTLQDGDISYVSILTNGAADYPESSDRTISFSLTFPDAGDYELYIKFRVGAGTFDDDSFFYGNGFGAKSPTDNNDWQTMNNLVNIGYTEPNELVMGEGNAGASVWKWLNFTKFTGSEAPVTFQVDSANQTKTFQIGAREDGLEIDKIAFGKAGYFYTLTNLENGEAGSSDSTSSGTLPIAFGKEKFLGNIYSNSQLPGFTEYWNQVAPENAGKWGSVEATRDVMNWGPLDAAYALAKDNGFPFRFHVLLWGNQQPSWIENLPPNEQLEEIEEWFAAVANRYPEIDYLEVVNEPLNDPPSQAGQGGGNYIDALGGEGTTGFDWIITAFTLARQYFPNTQLMINEYNIVNSTTNTLTYKRAIDFLLEDSLIDVIGFQAHAFSTTGDTSRMSTNMGYLEETGLPLMVTEMDIDGPTDQEQLEDYQRVFPLFWERPSILGITLWGWRTGMWRTDQMAYLMETDGVTERPALAWMRSYVNGTLSNEIIPDSGFRIYPNPIKSGKTLNLEGIQLNRLEGVSIFDLNGKLIKEYKPETQKQSWKIPLNLETGHYLPQIKGNLKSGSHHLIVK